MPHRSPSFRALLASALIALVAGPAVAQTAPPIKPGLWAYDLGTGGTADDAKLAQARQQMANLPPETRAKIDAMMKQRGLSMDGSGGIRVCQSRESLDAGKWRQGKDSGCKTKVTQRSSSAWKWRATCPDSESDGEAVFSGADAYTVNIRTTLKSNGAPRTVTSQVKAKYLGADCGDPKPLH